MRSGAATVGAYSSAYTASTSPHVTFSGSLAAPVRPLVAMYAPRAFSASMRLVRPVERSGCPVSLMYQCGLCLNLWSLAPLAGLGIFSTTPVGDHVQGEGCAPCGQESRAFLRRFASWPSARPILRPPHQSCKALSSQSPVWGLRGQGPRENHPQAPQRNHAPPFSATSQQHFGHVCGRCVAFPSQIDDWIAHHVSPSVMPKADRMRPA